MIQANGTSLGCAALLELNGDFSLTIHLVCHYARGFIPYMAVYPNGDPASACLTGPDEKYPALCSENEKFDPNYEIVVVKDESDHEHSSDKAFDY